MTELQGHEANTAGRMLERFVESECRERGFHVVDCEVNGGNQDFFAPNLLLKKAPYQNLYGTMARSEFVIQADLVSRRIRIECRWQQSSGSVDEKFPYLLWNAERCMPETEIILLVDGGGAKPAAVKWLKTMAAKSKKTIRVFTMVEFKCWLRDFIREAGA